MPQLPSPTLLHMDPTLRLSVTMAFPHLLKPLDLGFLILKNRVLMGALPTGLGLEEQTAFYAERARGGVGLIVANAVAPDLFGRLHSHTLVLNSEKQLPAHEKVTQAVHAEGGAICLQLLHAGRQARQPFCVGPSAVKASSGEYAPFNLNSWLIQKTIGRALSHAMKASLTLWSL